MRIQRPLAPLFVFVSLFLLAGLAPRMVWAQEALPPQAYGGSKSNVIDLRKGQPGHQPRIPIYDFEKFNSRYRSMVPQKRKCSTLEMEQDRKAKNGGGESKEVFEEWMQRRGLRTRGMRTRSLDVYSIPVVVHVVYSNPTENISREQVLSQLKVLNQDYRRKNPDATSTQPNFQNIAADAQIEFCLASQDPQGRPFNGINRVSISGAPFRDSYINEVIKPNTIWDPNRYMNIWVINIANGILGYAQFPNSSGLTGLPMNSGGQNTDGVVIHYNAFGTMGTANQPFNRGRTATHEIGHWLGLRHVWGDGPCGVDDFCSDTPESNGPHYGCSLGVNACFGMAMVQNFMDYSDDACMNLFTREQKTRMRNVLENSPRRRSLLTSTVCQAVGTPPVAEFDADIRNGCGPLVVNFQQQCEEDPTEFFWSFPGGTPASSTLPNPQVRYTQPGTYQVSLVAGNAAGKSPSLVKESYIVVSGAGSPLPLEVAFESTAFPPQDFFLFDPQGEKTWEQNSRVGGKGKSTGAFWFNNFDNNLMGSYDWLISPVLDLSDAQEAVLSFDLAYARFGGKYTDTLGVFISTGCESRFHALYWRGGEQLSTTQVYNRSFVPFPEEWRTEMIDLSEYDGEPFVRLAFVNVSGYGNNLYLDNIQLQNKAQDLPEPDFVALNPVTCAGEKVTFQNLSKGEVEKISWSFPGGLPASSEEEKPEVEYAQPGVYDVVLTVSNASGSQTEQRQRLITVQAGPKLQLVQEEVNICEGGSGKLGITGSGTSYTWAPAKGLSQTSGPEVTASPKATTTYTVTATDPNGCETTRSATVNVNRPSSFSIEPASATVCNGQGVTLTASGAGSYRWFPAEGLSNTNQAVVTATPSRTTTYTVTGASAGGCEFTRTLTVKVEDAPKIYVKAEKSEICPGEEVRIRATGSTRYRWTSSTGRESFEGEELVVTPLESTTYTVSTGTMGCSSSAEVEVKVRPGPKVVTEKSEYLVCPGTTRDLRVSGASIFRWLPNEGLVITRGASVPVNPRQSTVYTVIGSNGAGCQDTAQIKVTVPPEPKVELSISHPTICPGMQARIKAIGAVTYQWYPRIGLDRTFGPEVVASPRLDTDYTLRAADANGCIVRKSFAIKVATQQPPRANFTLAKPTACVGETIQFVDRSTNATTYTWEFPGGMPARSTEQNPKVTYYLPGTYDVILRIVGCNGRDEIIRREFVRVNRGKVLQVKDSVLTKCAAEKLTLEASGVREYRWSPVTGLSSFVGARVEANPLEDITYTVRGLDENGCESQARVRVNVRGSGKPGRIRSKTATICAGEEVRLQAGGASEYVWFTEGGTTVGTGAEVIVTPEATTTYRLEARDAAGCPSEDRATIEVRPNPEVNIQASRTSICEGEQLSLEASGAMYYEWYPEDLTDAAEKPRIFVKPTETTTFSVIGIDGFDCETETEIEIRVNRGEGLSVFPEKPSICKGQSISLKASGGSDYSWEPQTGLNLSSGPEVVAQPRQTTTYVVKSGNVGGCPATATVTVNVAEKLPLRISQTTREICPGETVRLTAEGGSGYQWLAQEGLRSLPEGTAQVRPTRSTTYRVTATSENGCPMEGSATVTVKQRTGLSLAASAVSICEGEEVNLKVSGGEVTEWLPAEGLRPNARGAQSAARPDQSATYRVVGVDSSGCRDTASLKVNVSRLTPGFISSADEIDLASEDGFVSFTDRTVGEPTEWEWDFGDGGTSTQQNPTHIYTREGTYEVTLFVSNGICVEQISHTLTLTNSSDLEALVDESGIRVFPKTTESGKVTISVQSEEDMLLKFRLLNEAGKAVLSDFLVLEEGSFEQTLDLSFFDKGSYVLQITDGEGITTHLIEYR